MRITNPGVPPKDPSTRRRTNTPKAEQTGIATITALPVVRPRPANPKWSEPIKDLYQGIIDSNVPKQSTDLAFAWLLLDTLHQATTHPNLTTGQVSASLVSSCLANLARLGVAHADRVRAGVILKSEQTTDTAKLAIMQSYRDNLRPQSDGQPDS
jgi:hypothetical protein